MTPTQYSYDLDRVGYEEGAHGIVASPEKHLTASVIETG